MKIEKILILKTASDVVVDKLLDEIDNGKDIYCLIQPSNIERYEIKYPEVKFINIQNERFEKVSEEVLMSLEKSFFEIIYIPHTVEEACYFENVILFVSRIKHGRIIFYNGNGERREVKKKGKLLSSFYKIMILYFRWLWRVGYSR